MEYFLIAPTLKGNYHNVQNLTVLFQPHKLLEKKMLYKTLQGPSAVRIGEPFEEHFLVAGKTLLVPFYM
jgi:hypothetical protein